MNGTGIPVGQFSFSVNTPRFGADWAEPFAKTTHLIT